MRRPLWCLLIFSSFKSFYKYDKATKKYKIKKEIDFWERFLSPMTLQLKRLRLQLFLHLENPLWVKVGSPVPFPVIEKHMGEIQDS